MCLALHPGGEAIDIKQDPYRGSAEVGGGAAVAAGVQILDVNGVVRRPTFVLDAPLPHP